MDDEAKYRLDDADRRISALDKKIDDQGKRFDDQGKRVDDIKWAIDRISAVFGAIFTLLVLVAGVNYVADRNRLREAEKQINDRLNKTDDNKIELFTSDGKKYLAGQEVLSPIVKFPQTNKPDTPPDSINGFPHLTFSFVAKNTGNDSSGPIFIKIYTAEGLQLDHPSSDESNFKYEAYLPPDTLDPNTIPAQMSIANDLRVWLRNPSEVKPGKYPALIRLYYGKAKIAYAPIVFVIPEGGH
jgi:hypothetical protein